MTALTEESTMAVTDTVTAQQVKALKNADDIAFHLYKGQAVVRAILRDYNPTNSTGFEQEVRIEAGGPRVHCLTAPRGAVADEDWTAFEMLNSVRYTRVGDTLLDHIKVGSKLSLSWVRGNSSPVVEDAGLVRDELYLHIESKSGKKQTLLVAVQVGKDNTARMVRTRPNF